MMCFQEHVHLDIRIVNWKCFLFVWSMMRYMCVSQKLVHLDICMVLEHDVTYMHACISSWMYYVCMYVDM
jgi:hypothetical protein